jgi:hypothetical protein
MRRARKAAEDLARSRERRMSTIAMQEYEVGLGSRV